MRPRSSQRGRDRRAQVVVAVRDVDGEDPVLAQRPVRVRQCLGGEEVGGHGVGRERVHDHEAQAVVRFVCEQQPAVADADLGRRNAIGQVGEVRGVCGDLGDQRVDLVEGEVVLGAGVDGQRPRAEAHDPDGARRSLVPGGEDVAHRPRTRVVVARVLATCRVQPLLAVHRGAMHQRRARRRFGSPRSRRRSCGRGSRVGGARTNVARTRTVVVVMARNLGSPPNSSTRPPTSTQRVAAS